MGNCNPLYYIIGKISHRFPNDTHRAPLWIVKFEAKHELGHLGNMTPQISQQIQTQTSYKFICVNSLLTCLTGFTHIASWANADPVVAGPTVFASYTWAKCLIGFLAVRLRPADGRWLGFVTDYPLTPRANRLFLTASVVTGFPRPTLASRVVITNFICILSSKITLT